MKMIVGLGNPGKEYNATRHNIGFIILDAYLGDVEWKDTFFAKYYTCLVNGEKVIFVKPETYMNLSGNAVGQFADYFKIGSEDIMVIQDDLDLPFGQVKLKKVSSAGGHNGIKSIIQNLGTDYFARFKFGIANENKKDAKDFVLGKFQKEEKEFIKKNQSYYNKIINTFIVYGIEKAMNEFNGN